MGNFVTDPLTDVKFPLRLFVFNGIGKGEVRRWTRIIEKYNGSVRFTVTGMADYVVINPNGKTSVTEYEKAKSWQRQGRPLQIFDVQDFRAFMETVEPTVKTGRKATATSFQKADTAEKQNIAMEYLETGNCGTYEEQAVIRYIKRNKGDLLKNLITWDDDRRMANFLQLYGKISLTDLDGYITRAKGKTAVTATLLQYKQQHYTWEQIMNADFAREEKAMGLRPLSVADWKQIYRFITRKEGVVLTEYLSDEMYLEVPSFIGKKPVLGALPGTYRGKGISSVNTPFILPLKDYFGVSDMPELFVMYRDETTTPEELAEAPVGAVVTMGSYPQTKHAGAEPVEWIVAERTEEDVLLVAKQALECLAFDGRDGFMDWNRSHLRTWLNDVFYRYAFSEEEQERILSTRLENRSNKEYGIKGSQPTTDKVFLLSLEDLKQHPELLACPVSDYVQEQKRKNGLKETCWWLRSPGGNHRRSAAVTEQGQLRSYGDPVYNSDWTVRPAMRVKR